MFCSPPGGCRSSSGSVHLIVWRSLPVGAWSRLPGHHGDLCAVPEQIRPSQLHPVEGHFIDYIRRRWSGQWNVHQRPWYNHQLHVIRKCYSMKHKPSPFQFTTASTTYKFTWLYFTRVCQLHPKDCRAKCCFNFSILDALAILLEHRDNLVCSLYAYNQNYSFMNCSHNGVTVSIYT